HPASPPLFRSTCRRGRRRARRGKQAARAASALAAGLLGRVLPAPARSRSSVLRWRGLRRPAAVLWAARPPTPVRWDAGSTPPPSEGARAPSGQTPGSGPEPEIGRAYV